ncbi:DUF6160 family protein [Marinobacteraceae bacterium S3BR75-40.1]
MKRYIRKYVPPALSLCLFATVASAEIHPLSEDSMGDITGQAGVSIDLSAKVNLAEFRYQDQGSLAIRDIEIGGANKATYFGSDWGAATYSGDWLDHLQINIDVMSDGDLVFFTKPEPGFGQAIDFSLKTGEWLLQTSNGTDGTRLLSNLSMTGLGLDFRMKVDNQTEHLLLETTFGIDDLDTDIEFLGIGIRDMKIAGTSYFESLQQWGYVGLPDIGAKLKLDIHKEDTPNVTNGLGIDINQFEADVDLPVITFGSAPSIGSVKINDLSLNGTKMVVYGH